MQHDEAMRAFARTSPAEIRAEAHLGRTRFRPWTRGRIAVILAAAIGIPWLPAPDAPSQIPPTHRARGILAAAIWSFAFAPDGQAVTVADGSSLVTLRRADHGWRIDPPAATDTLIVAISPDGRHLAEGGRESVVVACVPRTPGRGPKLRIPLREASVLRFSPDGRTLAVAGYCTCEITLWDVESGRQRLALRGHTSTVPALAFAPDGRTLASVSTIDPEVQIWDLATGRPRRRLPAPGVMSLAYSPDGRRLATADGRDKRAAIWDPGTGSRLASIGRHESPVRSVAFSPDGRLLATAGGDGSAGLWDVATGRELRRLDGQTELLRHIAFSPDGRTLAASAVDGDLRLWDLGGL
jgi:WD40 repeat protein